MVEERTPDEDDVELICSAKRCRAPAAHQLRWNNPKLHAPAARKVWLACDDHREHLGNFLGSRGFLREVWPVAAARTGGTVGGAGPATDGADARTT